jgi:branched-chain amino acid transport system permease protein
VLRGSSPSVRRSVYLLFAIAVILLIASIFSNDYIFTVLFFANLFAITAASWDILAGYAGQLSFGNVVFYGIGGYTIGLLSAYFGGAKSSLLSGGNTALIWLANPFVATCIGVGLSVGLAIVLGFSAIRLRGPYLAIVTFMVTVIMQELIILYGKYTGGQFGITIVNYFANARYSFYVSFALMVFSLFVLILISGSRYGLYFKAIRDDEVAAQATGINPTRYKLMAFAVSAAFTSLAGSLYVLAYGVVNYQVFSYNSSLLWIEMSVIGGPGTIMGSLIGSYFIEGIIEILRLSQTYSLIGFAIIFILVIRFFPQGLLGIIKRIIHWE